MKSLKIFIHCFFFLMIANAQTPKNLSLIGSINFPGQRLSGCWHYNDSAGNEYALIGAENGIVIANITDPVNPVELFQLPGNVSVWHDIKVQGDYAYAVTEGQDANNITNGVQIIDLRFLPDSAPSKFYIGDGIIANKLRTAHTITTAGHYIYVNGHNITTYQRGVLILDIVDPLFPVYVGAIANRYCHDSYVRGDTIYTSDGNDYLFSVYDISDRSNPILRATQNTWGYAHNSWLSDDGQTIFTADETPGTPVAAYDISDLNNISLLDTFYNGNFSIYEVHNVRVKNNFLINPSYGSQLTIADVSRPRNMIEIANYTTGSGLCWDADPFPNSGNILATDEDDRTFYIFSPTYIRACFLEGIVSDSITGLPIAGTEVLIQSVGIYKSTDFLGEYRTGYADSGSYTVLFSKANYYPKQITVSLQNGILTSLNVQLVPVGTGIDDLNESNLNLYPIPSNNEIHINSMELPIVKWQITDIVGRVVYQSDSKFKISNLFTIDINSLPSGIYTLTMNGSEKKLVKTFIKN